jgi:hypothetical protein
MKAQTWDFIKEKDGIKIYTRIENGRSLKSYKAITDINAPAQKIFTLMEDVNNTDWWDKKLTQIKVLFLDKGKKVQYYMVYDLPWPVVDRDLCVDVTITNDLVSGERKINAVSNNEVVPERKDMVRIKDYRQTWTITPAGNEMTHIVLDGFVDPSGSVPVWISNLLIIESPLKAINGLRDALGKNMPAKSTAQIHDRRNP